MHTIARQGIQEHGTGSHEGLTLTRSHLGHLALMEHGTTEQLYVIVYHVPGHVIATCLPVVVIDGLVAHDIHEVETGSELTVQVGGRHLDVLVLGEAFSGALHNGKGHGTYLVEFHLKTLQYLFLQFIYLGKEGRTVLDFRFLNLCLQRGNLFTEVISRVLHLVLDLFCLGT